MDHEGLALWDQSLEEIPIHGDTLRIIAYIGYDHSVLVFGKTFFQAAHSSQFGLTVYISSQKDTEPESVSIQDFTARIERLLQSHMTQETPCPVMWIWTGPGACEKELCSTIEKQIAPSTLTEMKFVEKPESFLARGLATRVFKKDLAPCNFRSGPLSHPQTLQWVMTRKMKRTMTSALCGLMLIALNMGWHFLIKQKNGQFQTVLTERASRLTGLSRIYKGQETYIVEQVFKEQVEMKTPFIKGVSFSLRPLFHKIGKIAYTDHIFIEDLFLGSERISLIGTVRQGHQTEKLAQYIREQGYTVTEEQQDSEPEKWVRFSIKGTQQNES
ncbi:MAG: hypothetical protein GKR87_15705 [Kiritimatiellae bacterium]|nr:hypothetical protein [Kiritimatiellia bacterium]